jgi:hypothetical protein
VHCEFSCLSGFSSILQRDAFIDLEHGHIDSPRIPNSIFLS